MTIYNFKHNNAPENAIRIDRRTVYGNPFHIGKDGTREEVIEKYRHWLWHRMKNDRIFMRLVANLAHRDLVCWCAPEPCHGDVLERAALWAERQFNNHDH